ncbi:MAG: helix-turn-helix domain-containing protein [Elusimicrobiota bacterium]
MNESKNILKELLDHKITPNTPILRYIIKTADIVLPSGMVISNTESDGQGCKRSDNVNLSTKTRKIAFTDKPRLLSAGDAAVFLGLHPQTVYDMAGAGTLPSFKIGKSRKFDINALNEWIERKKEERL